jgi:hypothetical protein
MAAKGRLGRPASEIERGCFECSKEKLQNVTPVTEFLGGSGKTGNVEANFTYDTNSKAAEGLTAVALPCPPYVPWMMKSRDRAGCRKTAMKKLTSLSHPISGGTQRWVPAPTSKA